MNAETHSIELPRWQRLLLPAMLGTADYEPNREAGRQLPRSARDWIVDLTLFACALMAGGGALHTDYPQASTALLVVESVLLLPACAALWVRRRYPVAVALGTVAMTTISGGACGAALVAVFSAAIHVPPRRAIQLAVLALPAGAMDFLINQGNRNVGWSVALWCVLSVAALICGSFVRVRRQLVLSLRERTRRLESEQQLRVREAQLEERTRIAREMHDVLAHRISLLSVHAGALEFNPDATAEEIARAASVIRVSARAAQEDLREVIGVLRADPDGEAVQPPQPTIGDLTTLVEESRHAGMDVSFASELPEVPTLVGRTIYRVVQEGLTNARKHSPMQPVTITLRGDQDSGALVQIVNRPAVGHAREVETAASAQVGSGTGLIGLTERVALLGGAIEATRLADGGFKLRATIPWATNADPEAPR